MLLIAGLVGILMLLAPVPQSQAGNPAPPTPVIEGPEIWATVIIDCEDNTVSLRAKRVVNCIVETQALVEKYQTSICVGTGPGGDLTETDLLYQWIHGPLFGEAGNPIVIRVKNFKKDTDNAGGHAGDVYSADVLIRFCTNCN